MDGERPATVGEVVLDAAHRRGDDVAVTFEDEQLTVARLASRASSVAAGLGQLGLQQGEAFGVMLPNRPESLDLWVAASIGGFVEVPVNTGYRGDSLVHVLRQAACSLVVVDAAAAARITAVRDQLPDLRQVLVVGGQVFEGMEAYADLLDVAAGPPPHVDPRSPASILFTSGTTGPSKGAIMCHRSTMRLAETICAAAGFTTGEVLYTAFPLFHTAARNVTVLPSLMVDGRAVVHQRFSASGFWDLTRREHVTSFNYMGAMLSMLCLQPPRPDDLQHDVRSAFGAGAGTDVGARFEERFGVPLYELYGMTETGTVTMNTVDDSRPGSCGRPQPYYQVAIHDEEDQAVDPGEVGEIVIRPVEPGVLSDGYIGMPEATLQTIQNLWFHTGDRGRLDADGYLYFVDRKKDSIRRRGENISSFEVEAVLRRCPGVAECAVVGVPSDLGDQEVLAVVVPDDQATLQPTALLDVCQQHLPHFAVPRYVRLAAALPRTLSERIEKVKLREIGVTEDTWDREAAGYEVTR